MPVSTGLAATAGVLAVPALSYLVEAFRFAPATPQSVDWAPTIQVRWVKVNGVKLRYVTAGSGTPIVLLHTLRTQLDMFQKVFPALIERFRVYALDYPGHGYSEIPDREYSPELFVSAVAGSSRPSELETRSLSGSRSAARSGYSSLRGTTRRYAQSSPSIRTTTTPVVGFGEAPRWRISSSG